MKCPVRFERADYDSEFKAGDVVVDADKVLAVEQHLTHETGKSEPCPLRSWLDIAGTDHRVMVRGSVSEVAEKLAAAVRGGSANVIGTDFMPYRGVMAGGGK